MGANTPIYTQTHIRTQTHVERRHTYGEFRKSRAERLSREQHRFNLFAAIAELALPLIEKRTN